MAAKRVKATYQGEDGANGFVLNTEYTLLLNQSEKGCEIISSAIGEDFVGRVTYDTIIDLLVDWTRVKTL